MLDLLKQEIFDICQQNRPLVWWSGGRDSTLILKVMIDLDVKYDLVQSRQHLSKTQLSFSNSFIKQHNLLVQQFPPITSELVQQDSDFAVKFHYISNHGSFFIAKDIIYNQECGLEKQTPLPSPMVKAFSADCLIFGTKKTDTHWLNFDLVQTKNGFYAPLWNWTDDQVNEALKVYQIEIPQGDEYDTGNIFACLNCLDKSKTQVFCPKKDAVINV